MSRATLRIMSDEDRETPVRRISTAALSLASIAAEELRQHLLRYEWSSLVPELDGEGKPVLNLDGTPKRIEPELPPGWVSRLASHLARGGRRIAQVEREETDRIRAELELVLRQRDNAIEEMKKVLEELKTLQRKYDQLTTLMRKID